MGYVKDYIMAEATHLSFTTYVVDGKEVKISAEQFRQLASEGKVTHREYCVIYPEFTENLK